MPNRGGALEDWKPALAWLYASGMAVLTAVAEGATSIEPDRLVWMLGLAGALFGVASLPSVSIRNTLGKLFGGWAIAGVLSSPLAASHYLPPFVNVHVAALWLGFAGPAVFVATVQGTAFLGWIRSRGASA